MLAFDASSIIHAWDNYPKKHFPPLRIWLSNGIDSGEFTMAQVAFEEVKKKAPDCAVVLKNAELNPSATRNPIALQQQATSLHRLCVGAVCQRRRR